MLLALLAVGLVVCAVASCASTALVVHIVARHLERTQTTGGASVLLTKSQHELQVRLIEQEKSAEHEKAMARIRAAEAQMQKPTRAQGALG